VRPTYGVERVEQILDTVLDECPNRKARFEAVNGLLQIAFVQPNRREEIIEVLYQLRTAEEMAQDYPPQDVDPNARSRGLNRIDETIEMIQSFLLNEVGGAECISDDEYVALQKLSKSELLERVRRGPLNDYALSYLMKNGCDDEELKYLFQLATKKRGHAAIKILSSISVTLLKPLEERTGTEADRHRLAAYVNMLEEARASSEPEDSGAWVQILTQELMRIAESDARPGEGNG
ncbi:MAG: hypothetical protein U9Q79_08030, partial [Candidatus Hydrogenedentes bacterium]|nr:hypothetical protein [Candidatus Hydrogenedentota bacterium]